MLEIVGDNRQQVALPGLRAEPGALDLAESLGGVVSDPVSYTHLRAHETVLDLVCRLLLEKKKQTTRQTYELHYYANTSNIHYRQDTIDHT